MPLLFCLNSSVVFYLIFFGVFPLWDLCLGVCCVPGLVSRARSGNEQLEGRVSSAVFVS